MKQNIKKVLLVLCMTVCFFALSACGSKNDVTSEPIPEEIESAMISGAEDFLKMFDSYDDAALDSQLKQMQKQKNTVMESAFSSWKNSKSDLGKLVSILSETVERLDESSYQVTIKASYEKRELVFNLTAEESLDNSYGGGVALVPTELVFSPVYTTGEKLEKAAMNTLMGMGTVFLVLIFISFIIGSLKGVNSWEERLRAKKEAKEEPAQAAVPVPAAAPVPAPAAAPIPAPAPVPVPVPVVETAPAAVEEPVAAADENLADDMELVAVITAAIAAASSVPVEGLVVRSIRRKSGSKWKNA